MFKWDFFLEEKTGNNALSYKERYNKKLYIPALIKWDLSDVKIWNKVVFEDFSFENEHEIVSSIWLENYVEMSYDNTPLYVFDNHNIALYFWYKHYFESDFDKWVTLVHIDEHSDLRPCPDASDFSDIERAYENSVKICNVGNYIEPSIRDWLIKEVIQIRSEENINNFDLEKINWDIILNLDLDFFSPHLDYIDYELKKKIILETAKTAKLITVSTSPFFINQELAIKVLRDIFR